MAIIKPDGDGGLWKISFTTRTEQRAADELGIPHVKAGLPNKAAAEHIERRVRDQIDRVREAKLKQRRLKAYFLKKRRKSRSR